MKRKQFILILFLLVISFVISSCGFSYESSKMLEYVEFDSSLLQDFHLPIDKKWEIDEEDIQNAIHLILLQNRTKVNNAQPDPTHEVEDGDDLSFYYCIVSENGTIKTDGYDFGSSRPITLTIGGKSFPYADVEDSFLGLKPEEYALRTEGTVSSSDTIFYLKYSYTSKTEDENQNTVYVSTATRFDLNCLETTFASNFFDCIIEAEYGSWISFSAFGDYFGNGEIHEREFQVMVCASAEKEYTKSLVNGELFCAQLISSTDYVVPEYTDDFIQNTLGLFLGEENPKQELENTVRSILLEDDDRRNAIETAFWTYINTLIIVKDVPKSKVKEMKKTLEYELDNLYQYYKNNYYNSFLSAYGEHSLDSIENFARIVYGEKDKTYSDILQKEAEELVKQDMILFILKANTDIIDTKNQYEEDLQSIINSYQESTGLTKKKLFSIYGGEEYFISHLLFDRLLEALDTKELIIYQ